MDKQCDDENLPRADAVREVRWVGDVLPFPAFGFQFARVPAHVRGHAAPEQRLSASVRWGLSWGRKRGGN